MNERQNSRPNVAARRRAHLSRAASTLALCLLTTLAPHAAAAHARQERPNIADEVKGDAKSKTKSGARGSGSRQDADAPPPRNSNRTTRRAVRNQPRASANANASLLPVTIHTGAADVSIYVSRDGASAMHLLGRTGGDGRLSTRLARGVHSLTASRPGSRIVRQQIDVRPGNTTFSLDLSGRNGADGARVSATSAADVFTRFLDPKRTDSVTLADWQLAREQTAAAYSQNSLDPLNTAQALFAEGQVLYLRGDYAAATVAFNNAALTVPGSALAYYGLGNAYLATNQLSEAARAYQQAIRNEARMALAYKGVGDVFARQGKDKEALDYYGRARSQGYDSPTLDAAVGRSLLKLRRWQQALDTLLPISRRLQSAEVLVGVGDAYVGLKQPMSAAVAYRQATQTDPKSAVAHYKLGELSSQMREYATAVDALERALALDPAGTIINRARARELADAAARRLGRKD